MSLFADNRPGPATVMISDPPLREAARIQIPTKACFPRHAAAERCSVAGNVLHHHAGH